MSVTADEFNIVELLGGTWTSPEQGWNLIALPDPDAAFNFRVMVNQYGEELTFDSGGDKGVPNRGIQADMTGQPDQFIDATSYRQFVRQVEVDNSPQTDKKAANGDPIHHEPGFFMHVLNHTRTDEGNELNLVRLASIPHGDTATAMGHVTILDGPPTSDDTKPQWSAPQNHRRF